MSNSDFKLSKLIKKGFTHHTELNPELFDKNNILHKEVRNQLMVIANDFIESLNIDHVDFEDIIIVGSIVNYNWNPYSDVDLHVTYDFNDIDGDKELVTEFFLAKKSSWNQEHDVKIYGYDVELYGQDMNETVESGGIYSVFKNEWIKEPKTEDYKISEESLIKKTKHFTRLIDDVLALDASDQTKIKKLDVIKDKIKKYRKSGLESGGEYSEENLVFKMLRRTNYMEKLYDETTKLKDKMMSLSEVLNLPKKVHTLFDAEEGDMLLCKYWYDDNTSKAKGWKPNAFTPNQQYKIKIVHLDSLSSNFQILIYDNYGSPFWLNVNGGEFPMGLSTSDLFELKKQKGISEGLNLVKRVAPEIWFKDLLLSLEQVTSPAYPKSIFFMKDGLVYMHYIRNHTLAYDSDLIHKILREHYKLKTTAAYELIKPIFEDITNSSVTVVDSVTGLQSTNIPEPKKINESLNLKKKVTPEIWFKDLLLSLDQVTSPEYHNTIFFMKNNLIYMQYKYSSDDAYLKNTYLNCDYIPIGKFLKDQYNMKLEEIHKLIRLVFEEVTNLSVDTLDTVVNLNALQLTDPKKINESLNLAKKLTPVEWFTKLLSKLKLYQSNKNPDRIYFKLNGVTYMILDTSIGGQLAYSHKNIAFVLEDKFGLNSKEISDLIKGVVESKTRYKIGLWAMPNDSF